MRTMLVLLGWLLLSPLAAHAASASFAWTAGPPGGIPLAHYQMQRCSVPGGKSSCAPSVDLASGVVPKTQTTFVDATVAGGTAYCWTVLAVGTDQSRAQVKPGADGKPYVCATVPFTLPPPGPTTTQPLPVGLRLTWPPPVYAGSDATPDMLTRYDIWRRTDPGTSWATVGTAPATRTTFDDPAATTDLAPGVCYEVRAVYHPISSVGNGLVCVATTSSQAPLVPAAPTNLRFVP
jgi:hypothetical protein